MLMSNQHYNIVFFASLLVFCLFVFYYQKRSWFVGMKSKINKTVLKSYQHKIHLGILFIC